MAKMIVVKK